MHPNPFVIQLDPQLLHYASVLYVDGAAVQRELFEVHDVGAETVPVPKHGPSFAVNLGHDYAVPVKEAQGYGLTQPEVPPHTQLAIPAVGGYQAEQSASLFAVVFNAQVLLMQASVEAAIEVFVQGMLFPMNALQMVWVPL